MRHLKLNNTPFKVSSLCLGTVNYGTRFPADSAFHQLDKFFGAGGNFIDTAHVYGDWEPGTRGISEQTLREWFKKTGMRDKCVIVTKGAHPRLESMDVSRVTVKDIKQDIAESLDCLGIDCVDIYFLHRDNPKVPVGEILDLLEELRAEKKIKYYGCSNWTLPRVKEAADWSQSKGYSGFVCNQLMWSLADVSRAGMSDKTMVMMDKETYVYHRETGLNAMAYMSMAKGYFPLREKGAAIQDSVTKIYNLPQNDKIFEVVCKISRDINVAVPELCLAYISGHEFPSVPIASFENDEELETALKSCDRIIKPEIINQLQSLKSFAV